MSVSTPSARLRLTPSNSPFLHRTSRSPMRGRPILSHVASDFGLSPRFALRRVVGTTCASPAAFDSLPACFAYVAGGAVVVVDVAADAVEGDAAGDSNSDTNYSQRFYRARPTAVPLYALATPTPGSSGSIAAGASLNGPPSTPTSTPKAGDSRRVASISTFSPRDYSPAYNSHDWGADSPGGGGRTWTSRERIKAATCLSLSRDARYLAVGETGYAPRVLIFSLRDGASSDTPLVSIGEHTYGVNAVLWSPDTRFLASLGVATDGFLYIWKIDPRTGAARLHQQNRCTATVRGMVWMGGLNLVTFGLRHIKVWRVEELSQQSPTKTKFQHLQQQQQQQQQPLLTQSQQQQQQQENAPTACDFSSQKPLAGRNVLLGSLIDMVFTCALALDEERVLICSDAGDVCLLAEQPADKQVKLVHVTNLGFAINCMALRPLLDQVMVAGKSGERATLDVKELLGSTGGNPNCVLTNSNSITTASSESPAMGIIALGSLTASNQVVVVDTNQSIRVSPNPPFDEAASPPALGAQPEFVISGQGEAIEGVQPVPRPNEFDAAFVTWSGSGKVTFWDLDGKVKALRNIPLEKTAANEFAPTNQLSTVRVTIGAKLLVTADKLGVLRIMGPSILPPPSSSSSLSSSSSAPTYTDSPQPDSPASSNLHDECLLDSKAHASECHSINVYEDDSRFLVATCGRDRIVQLFQRCPDGSFEHFQTLEFTARVAQVLISNGERILSCSLDRAVQIHDLVARDGDPDVLAAIPSRLISLKATPTSMMLSADEKSVYVSLLDRSVYQADIASGKHLNSFKCVNEGGSETAVLDSLTLVSAADRDSDLILGISNTDKSVRLYDSQSGSFLDREWGHTEAINGVIQVASSDDGSDNSRKAVSVGSDGTIMIWAIHVPERSPSPGSSASRDPSPAKDGALTSRPTLRRVLSRAELAEFQRPSSASSSTGRRSPPRAVQRRTSRLNLSVASSIRGSTTPVTNVQSTSPTSTVAEETPTRRSSTQDGRAGSPPTSPKARVLSRRPSLPALKPLALRSKHSSANLRSRVTEASAANSNSAAGNGSGSLSIATEQTCRALRTYRKKLTSLPADSVGPDMLAELDGELRLTAVALSDRLLQSRSKAVSETVLTGLLDEYSERLVSLLGEKLGLETGGGSAKRHGKSDSCGTVSSPCTPPLDAPDTTSSSGGGNPAGSRHYRNSSSVSTNHSSGGGGGNTAKLAKPLRQTRLEVSSSGGLALVGLGIEGEGFADSSSAGEG